MIIIVIEVLQLLACCISQLTWMGLIQTPVTQQVGL